MAGDDQFPELIFGIAGPIGVDIAAICDSLANALSIVGYTAHSIHLTEEMKKYPLREHTLCETDSNYFSEVSHKIDYANALCKEAVSSATLARVALRAIALKRAELACLAIKLMARDASEDDHDFGQELRETFHRADVFIDGLLKHEMEVMACTRFRRHRVRCFNGTGGWPWSDDSLRESSSLKRCA
jgi:hypothetical protein